VGDVTEVVVRELEQLVDEEEMAVVGVGDVALVGVPLRNCISDFLERVVDLFVSRLYLTIMSCFPFCPRLNYSKIHYDR